MYVRININVYVFIDAFVYWKRLGQLEFEYKDLDQTNQQGLILKVGIQHLKQSFGEKASNNLDTEWGNYLTPRFLNSIQMRSLFQRFFFF